MIKFIGTYAIMVGLSLISFHTNPQAVSTMKSTVKAPSPEYVKVVTVTLKINNADYKFIVRPDQDLSIIKKDCVLKNKLIADSSDNPQFKHSVTFKELSNSKFYVVESEFLKDEDGVIGKDIYDVLKEELEKQIKN